MVKDKEQEKKEKKKNGCPEKKRPSSAYMLWVKDQWHEVNNKQSNLTIRIMINYIYFYFLLIFDVAM